MSELLTKEKLDNILADLEAEDELYEQQKPYLEPEGLKGEASAAEMMLARSVKGKLPDHRLIPEESLSLVKEDDLEKDGCQFIDAIYLFLDELGCPPDARDFVLAIAGISRGNYTDLIPMTDDQIGRRMGFERSTIRRKRKSLVEWERNNGWSVLEIHEKEFNRDKMKYKPTEYRVIVTPFAAKFIREYRKRTSFKNGYKALENEIADEVNDIATEIAKDLPDAPLVKRQQKKYEAEKPKLGGKPLPKYDEDQALIAHFDRWCSSKVNKGYDLLHELQELQWKLNEKTQKYLGGQKAA